MHHDMQGLKLYAKICQCCICLFSNWFNSIKYVIVQRAFHLFVCISSAYYFSDAKFKLKQLLNSIKARTGLSNK